MDQQIDYQQLAVALLDKQAGTRTKAVSTTPTAVYGHGSGGIFSFPGLSQPLFSAMILPHLGLQAQLPVNWSNETNPIFGIITGVTDTTGSEQDGPCDDPPYSGVTKLCNHTFVFGKMGRMTKVFDIDRVGEITNRGEFNDFRLMGNPFAGMGSDGGVFSPSIPGMNPSTLARNEIGKSLFELGVAWVRDFARLFYAGTPANNSANGGYKEFYGLDTLINTGYRDAESGIACPAADSIVRSFGDLPVEDNMAAIVRQITNIFRNLRHLAYRANLVPAKWKIAMTYNLFYQLTEGWPCTYMSYRCQGENSATMALDTGAVERMRDEMRGDLENYTGQYLLIDGQKVPVVIDDGITETENQDGTFTSDIYFVPLTVLGNTPVTYWEAFNYAAPGAAIEFAKQFSPEDSYFTSDNGRFLWHKKPPSNTCVQLVAWIKPRVLLLTPYLAARLTDVRCEPLEHERSPFSDSDYFADGGRWERGAFAPSWYSPTA